MRPEYTLWSAKGLPYLTFSSQNSSKESNRFILSWASVFVYILCTWVRAVDSAMKSFSAMYWVVRPASRYPRTSVSRLESPFASANKGMRVVLSGRSSMDSCRTRLSVLLFRGLRPVYAAASVPCAPLNGGMMRGAQIGRRF